MTLTQPRTATLTDVVDVARLAPSVHNTQPWTWCISGTSLELYADDRRRLTATDPSGQQLVISCGVALHHAQVAAAGLGWHTEVERVPAGDDAGLLARIVTTPAPATPAATATLAALRTRRTDRRRLTSWPVPEGRLRRLADTASEHDVVATPIIDGVMRDSLEALLARAHELQREDHLLTLEQEQWIDRSSLDGVPSGTISDAIDSDPRRRSRFGAGLLADGERDLEHSDALLVLGTPDDDRSGWLRAGEALSALWLDATTDGLSVVPLSPVIEVAETRRALQRDVLGTFAVPHVLVRIGWPAIIRAALPPTPRRPLTEVLRSI